jgi:type II secretory pathway component PulF
MSTFYENLATTAGLCVLGLVLLYLSRTRDLPISEQLRWGRVWLRVMGWACLLVGGFLAGSVLFAGSAIVILIIIFAVASFRGSRYMASEMWLTIAAGVRHQLPIPPLVEALVEESGTAARYRQLLARLRAGMPLEELVRKLRIGRPEQTALALAAKTGQLEEAIAKSQQLRIALRDVEELFTGRLLLLLIVLQIVPVAAYVFQNINRQFTALLRDFGMSDVVVLSHMTTWLPEWSVSFWFLGLIWTVGSLTMVAGIFIYWLGGYGVLQDLWPSSRCSFRSRILILLNLAQGVRAGLPIPEILDVLINNPPTFAIRGRLLNALEAVFRGTDVWEALRKSRIISQADADILAASQQLGELPASLDTLATLYRDRYSVALRRWAIIGYLIIVSVVVLGSVILYACTFGTLLTILSHLM